MAKITATKSKMLDAYSQIAFLQTTQSAANTLTFSTLQTGLSLFNNYAMLIQRIDYEFTQATIAELQAATDQITWSLTGTDQMTSLSTLNAQVYTHSSLLGISIGVPATGVIFQQPLYDDFTNLSGGGILVPADRLFLGVDSAGYAAAATVSARIRFILIQMGAQEYLELVQGLRVLT